MNMLVVHSEGVGNNITRKPFPGEGGAVLVRPNKLSNLPEIL